MINFIQNLYRIVNTEMRQLRLNLIYVMLCTIAGVVMLLLFKPSVGSAAWFTFLPWIISGIMLFLSQRLINISIAAGGIGLLRSLGDALRRSRGEDVETREQAVTEFSRIYISVISNIFLVQTALFLVLPLYVNYTFGGMTTAIIILMLMVVIAIDNFTSFRRLSRSAVKMAVAVYAIGLVIVLFPQVGFYANYLGADKIRFVPQSSAQLANQIDQLRAKQREEQSNARLREGLAWQRNNPGKDLPPQYKKVVEENGKIISFKEEVLPEPEKSVATVVVPERRSSQSVAVVAQSNSQFTERELRMAKQIYGK